MHPLVHMLRLGLSPGALLILGNILWVITYLVVIRIGFRDRTYGIPMLAICLNITWELFFFLDCPLVPPCQPGERCICPALDPTSRAVVTAWMVLDALILFQLLRFGRAHQHIPEIRRYFYPVIAGALGFAFFWHYSYITFYEDLSGIEDAWGINLVMSVLFVLMLFLRPRLAGVSLFAGVTKMLGSALNAVGLLMMGSRAFPRHPNPTMMYFLFASVFAFDVAYIWLVYRRQQQASSSPAPAGALPESSVA